MGPKWDGLGGPKWDRNGTEMGPNWTETGFWDRNETETAKSIGN
jgi:hypothetical protein